MRQALSIRYELKRTCGLEAKAVNIACLGHYIRSLQAHVPLTNRYLLVVSIITEG